MLDNKYIDIHGYTWRILIELKININLLMISSPNEKWIEYFPKTDGKLRYEFHHISFDFLKYIKELFFKYRKMPRVTYPNDIIMVNNLNKMTLFV